MKSRLPALLVTLIFILGSPTAVFAQDANLNRIQTNVKAIDNYIGWFNSTTPVKKSTVNDEFDQANFPIGMEKFLTQFYGWYGIARDKDGDLIINNKKDTGEKFETQYLKWRDECRNAAERLTKDGNSYKDLITKFETLAKSENLTDETRKTIADYTDQIAVDAQKVVRTPSCIYALANAFSSLDNYDIECMGRKLIDPSRSVNPGIRTKAQFLSYDEGKKCKSQYDDLDETLVKWQPIPGCVGGFQCEVALPIDKNANKYYTYNSGFSTEAKTWHAFLKKVDANLKAGYKKLEELGGQAKKDTAEAQARAAAELTKGAVVGLSLPLSDIKIPTLIGRIISQILGVVGAVGLAAFIYGGIQYMTASGNPERAERGRKTIVWSTLGLVAIFAAYAIVKFITEAIVK